MSEKCKIIELGLALLCPVLLVSLVLNVVFCVLRHKRSAQYQNSSRNCLSEVEASPPGDVNNYAPEENYLQQENPIYGNITGSVVYEAMAVRARRQAEPAESDVNYASLDLKLAMKRKRQSHPQGLCPPARLQDRLTPPPLMGQVDYSFPPTEHGPMEPHSTIYLNSQQIDMERGDNNEQRLSGWDLDAERQEEDRDGECGNDQRLKDENKDDTDHMAGSDAHQY